ncbi:flagellar hook-basal body complex protein FliE [Roseibium aestuarii]|uniref:Flagellar hook-basal body complex protein FliE n=1 Tax=Roseibium aestuarii TaxID=2600299 RepID=A0ABW4JW92_9HYPH|nr:flagellar hook-basal body complex protein FliE [Roseibium aestuarii]
MIDQISGLSSVSGDLTGKVSTTRYVASPAAADSAFGPEAAGDASFSQMMASVSQDAINRLKEGEATSIAGVDGQASVQQVVEAVMAAEQSLQTAIAIRDKVVQAYQEISRMAI